ncbi:MAG: Y-family DNA polymerase [Synergistales bacterium]|nr:Y-family DNA polymerase [Synergistales bacterium]
MLIALCDCDNFYVSCERVRNAALRDRPVVVLSNNDGCIVARSPKVKALGVAMGTPYFKVRPFLERHNVAVLSGDHAFYNRVSRQVMDVLRRFSPLMEVYSIDEAFLSLDILARKDPAGYARDIRRAVWRQTGVPLSIGVADTKTLAKVAVHHVKRNRLSQGVFVLPRDAGERDAILRQTPVEEIWGVGRRLARGLRKIGLTTAEALRDYEEAALKGYGIRVVQMAYELRGIPCYALRERREPRKSVSVAKSFGRPLSSYGDLAEAAAAYVADAAERMRRDGMMATCVQVAIMTNRFDREAPQYAQGIDVRLAEPTEYTPTLVKAALRGIEEIYRSGYSFKKVSVVLAPLVPRQAVQPRLFAVADRSRQRRLMRVVDSINASGEELIWLAGSGEPGRRSWAMRRDHPGGAERVNTERSAESASERIIPLG